MPKATKRITGYPDFAPDTDSPCPDGHPRPLLPHFVKSVICALIE